MVDLNKNIEKILLGMKYDSRKTLSENKNDVLDYIIEKGADGLDLVLPKTAEVTSRINCSSTKNYYSDNIELIQKDWPFLKACQQKFGVDKGKIDNCQLEYFNSFISKCIEGSVKSFKLDGLEYRSCFSIKKNGAYTSPENIGMKGYFTKTTNDESYEGSESIGCKGKKWMGMENYRLSSGRFDDKGGKEGIEGGKGPEYGDSFSVELN
jgi:hypothetical protein